MRAKIGKILRELCEQKDVTILEATAKIDHIHLCVMIAPKYSVAHVIGFLKGKSAIRIHNELRNSGRKTGRHFWARGYCVSTVGYDEATIRQYIKHQDGFDRQQMSFDY